MTLDGDRMILGGGKVTLDLERKLVDGPRHYVEATTTIKGLPLKPPPVAFLLELGADGNSMAIHELKDVDWASPARARRVHPVSCRRR
jgi:hypothetical protein